MVEVAGSSDRGLPALKPWHLRRIGFVLSAAALLLSLGCLVEGPAQRCAEELREDIRTELQQGAPVHDVAAFLERHGIEEHSQDRSTRTVRAVKRGIWAGIPVEATVQLRFYFDEDERLERSEVEIVYTGP